MRACPIAFIILFAPFLACGGGDDDDSTIDDGAAAMDDDSSGDDDATQDDDAVDDDSSDDTPPDGNPAGDDDSTIADDDTIGDDDDGSTPDEDDDSTDEDPPTDDDDSTPDTPPVGDECTKGEQCESGTCYTPAGQETGYCTFKCAGDGECPLDWYCGKVGSSSVCQPRGRGTQGDSCLGEDGMSHDSMCYSGYCDYWNETACGDECTSDEQCPVDWLCLEIERLAYRGVKFCAFQGCIDDTYCQTEYFCYVTEKSRVCRPFGDKTPGESCDDHQDCANGYCMFQGICAFTCGPNAPDGPDCPPGGYCEADAAGSARPGVGICKEQ